MRVLFIYFCVLIVSHFSFVIIPIVEKNKVEDEFYLGLFCMYWIKNELYVGSYSNPTSVSRCSLCNSPRPSESASNREEPSSEATISVSSSVDVNPATLLSQQSSKLFSIDTNKSSSTRKTLGLKRTLTSSQRSLGLSRPNSLSI